WDRRRALPIPARLDNLAPGYRLGEGLTGCPLKRSLRAWGAVSSDRWFSLPACSWRYRRAGAAFSLTRWRGLRERGLGRLPSRRRLAAANAAPQTRSRSQLRRKSLPLPQRRSLPLPPQSAAALTVMP